MNQKIFINEAITEGINNYLNNENSDDFITIIIKTLINIYGELDIINPYKAKSESGLGSFDENITKFGYTKENLSIFKQNIMEFYLSKNKHPNKFFNKIEKDLIDMFFLKIENINNDKTDFKKFEDLLLFENSYLNELFSTDKEEIRRYYSYKKKMKNLNNLEYKIVNNNTLSKEAYEMAGYSYDNIIKMDNNQLIKINDKVFGYFKIDQTRDDKFLRLEQAISYYKEFPKEEKRVENGYVEFLLLSGFIAISLLVIVIIVGVLSR